jgi:nicotinate phosphoribosyltransferase
MTYINKEDLPLYDLPQIFAASNTWFEAGMKEVIATFDLIVRDMPPNRNFLVLGGLDEIIKGVMNWKYKEEDVQYLLKAGIITKGFADYLRKFKFSGSIKAMKEGSIFFQGEPVIRITAPLIEANLLTMFLMNALTGNSLFISKIIRNVIAAKPKTCLGVAGLRAQSFESALKCARAAYIAGAIGGNSVPTVARKLEIPLIQPLTVAYHAVIKSFKTEIEAMRVMANLYKGKISLMVDTYDFKEGVRNAITVARELKEKGQSLYGIMIDSGDLYELCVQARKMLNEAGFQDVKITLASNLDEFRIKELNEKNVPADAFLIATEAIAVPDAPKLETVYKLAKMKTQNKTTLCAKFASGKESYPGDKQVFRIYEKNKIKKDIIGLENENLGEPLLIDIIKNGELVFNIPSIEEIKEYLKEQITKIPENLLDIKRTHKFKVEVSKNLSLLFNKVKEEHVKIC